MMMIPPKKSRGKGLQGKKTIDVSQETVDVYEESKPKPQLAKKKTASRRVVKKKVIISADDNIIPNLEISFELCKSISSTKAAEKEAARQVHAIHVRIMTEYVPKPSGRRLFGISIKETSQGSKKKLKGVQPLTLEEQEAADIMQALKESKKTNRRQQGTGGSSKGTGRHLGVPYESTIVSATSSEGTGTKLGVPDDEKDDIDGDADDEGDDHISDIQDADDVDMAEPETIEHENKEKDDMTDAAKPDAKKSAKENGDAKKAKKATGSNYQVKDSTEFPLPFSCLSVSSGFGTQLFNSSSDIFDLKVPVSVILKTTNLLPIPEILTETLVSSAFSLPQVTPTIAIVQQTITSIPSTLITTDNPTITIVVPESNSLTVVQLRVAKLEKDVSKLKNINLSAEALGTLKSQVPIVVDDYLGSKLALIEDENVMDKGVADTVKDHKRKHDNDNDDDDDDDEDPPAGPN
ncbi:hypothetical protein Tco_0175473 [Tanacetum coccineum]